MGVRAEASPSKRTAAASKTVLRARASGPRDLVAGGTLGPDGVLELQRARILAAMSEVCAELGSGSMTVAHVVERAGVSRRTFYELFADREDCFLAAFEDALASATRHVLETYDPKARWVERIRSALTGLLSFLDVEPKAGQLLIVGSLGAGAQVLERRKQLTAQVIAVLDEGRGETSSNGDLPPLTAEGVLGGVLSILHARLLEPQASPRASGSRNGNHKHDSLLELTGPLMGMIVMPYLGARAARAETARPLPNRPWLAARAESNPLMGLEMRLTYRTVRVVMAIAAHPGSSNRLIADAAGISDQGQMSKLLARLQGLDLIANTGAGAARGEPNAWTLTQKGWHIQTAITRQTALTESSH